jgi:hypothetical protein
LKGFTMADPNYIDMFINAYTSGYMHLPQERRNVFDGKVSATALTGEYMSFDDIASGDLQTKTTRFAAINPTDRAFRRRWMSPSWYYDALLVDKQDNIALHTDPSGDFMTSLTYAIERKKMDTIIASFDASVVAGKTPGADTAYSLTNTAITNAAGRTVPHDVTNSGAAGGISTGLTVNKLVLIREKFATLGIPDGVPINLVTSFKQKSDLLREAETQSTDTSDVKALVNGTISKYMGINFIETNKITLGSSNDIDADTNVYECFAWIPEGIKYAQFLSPSFKVTARDDLVGDVWQIKVDFGCSAIRMNESMVLKVECANV